MKSSLGHQTLRYVVGGATTAVLTWGCVWLFVEKAHWHYLVSTNAATFVAYFYSYTINKRFVFGDRAGEHSIKGAKFLALQLSLLGLANVMMFVGVSLIGFHYMPAIAVVSALTALINFSVMRFGIFDPA